MKVLIAESDRKTCITPVCRLQPEPIEHTLRCKTSFIIMMAMSFDYDKDVDLSKARELLVYIIENYLSAINSNIEVRPYLHNYPFTAKNIEIRIWIRPGKKKPPFGEIYCFAALEGELIYDTKTATSINYQTLHEETYEEALKIVEGSSL